MYFWKVSKTYRMIKIGLLSDTHSYLDPKLEAFFAPCDEIWHAGDIGNIVVTDTLKKWKPLRAVFGNIDDHKVRSEFPEFITLKCEEVKILMLHIGGSFGRYSSLAKSYIEKYRPKLFICGHSHILKVQYDKKNEMLYMNPGASGRHGFHAVRTAVRFSIDGANIKDLEIVELEVRK